MTSTMIEERVQLRMRGGPPWGIGVEGNPPGPVYVSRLRQRSSGKEQQIRLGDEVVSINGRNVEGMPGNVAMSIVDNSVGVLELEVMRKRYEDGPGNDFTSTAYSQPKIQPQPQPQSYHQPQVYQPQPTYQQPYQSQPPAPYQPTHYTPQPTSPPQQPYQNQPYTQSRYQAQQPAYQESHSSIQTRPPAPATNGYMVERRPSHTMQVTHGDDKDNGGGLKVKKKTTTTTRVLTKTGGDKSERTVTKTVTEKVGNKETTTTTTESSANDGYMEESGPRSVVKETRFTDEPVENLMVVAPASQGTPGAQEEPTWAKKTPPWAGQQQKKKKPVPPPPKPKPKPRPPVPTQEEMDRFQPIRFSPTGSPAGSTSGASGDKNNYNSKPRGWTSPPNVAQAPRSVDPGNAEGFRSPPMVPGEQPRKGSDGFTDFNARPRGFHPSNFTPARAGMVE